MHSLISLFAHPFFSGLLMYGIATICRVSRPSVERIDGEPAMERCTLIRRGFGYQDRIAGTNYAFI